MSVQDSVFFRGTGSSNHGERAGGGIISPRKVDSRLESKIVGF